MEQFRVISVQPLGNILECDLPGGRPWLGCRRTAALGAFGGCTANTSTIFAAPEAGVAWQPPESQNLVGWVFDALDDILCHLRLLVFGSFISLFQ